MRSRLLLSVTNNEFAHQDASSFFHAITYQSDPPPISSAAFCLLICSLRSAVLRRQYYVVPIAGAALAFSLPLTFPSVPYYSFIPCHVRLNCCKTVFPPSPNYCANRVISLSFLQSRDILGIIYNASPSPCK
jgi:hypothetical protein